MVGGCDVLPHLGQTQGPAFLTTSDLYEQYGHLQKPIAVTITHLNTHDSRREHTTKMAVKARAGAQLPHGLREMKPSGNILRLFLHRLSEGAEQPLDAG